jgi:pimeloyl-ACP methyl ester carboxylesterase
MTKLHFLDTNPSGTQAVLLLHGLGATGASWTLQLPALTGAGFRPIAPDAPGFGDSPYDGRGWSASRGAAELAALLVELGTGPVHVVGLSMGGVIAQQFVHDFPQLTRKLVLVSTFSALRPDDLSGWIYFLRRILAVSVFGLRAQARVVAGRIFPNPDQAPLREMLIETISRADPRAYRGAMRALGLYDSRKWLAQIQAPTLVVTGTADSTVSPTRQKLLLEGIPGAHQVVIQDAGHALTIDHAETFNRILLEFLCAP